MRAWFYVVLCSLGSMLYGESKDTLIPLNPTNNTHKIPIEKSIQENLQENQSIAPQKDISVQLDTYSLDGYSVLELNNKSFRENEVEAALWRAGVGYKVHYKFSPTRNTLINFHFGTSIEITQNRLGGKTKTYDDGLFNEDHTYDWGSRILQSGSVSNFGITVSIAGKHHIQITIRQLFLDNAALLKQYASSSYLANGVPWVSAQNQLTSVTNRIFNNTQILASYSLYF